MKAGPEFAVSNHYNLSGPVAQSLGLRETVLTKIRHTENTVVYDAQRDAPGHNMADFQYVATEPPAKHQAACQPTMRAA